MYYVAYGSNLNKKEMKDRCPSSIVIGSAILKNKQLVFKGSMDGYAYLTLEPGVQNIPVGIFKVHNKDIKNLDIYEGYPDFYNKEIINVRVRGKEVSALIYLMNDGYKTFLPSISYFNRVIDGYNDFNFNKSILYDTYDKQKRKRLI